MNAQSDRGWMTVLVTAVFVTLAAAKASRAQQTFSVLVNFHVSDGANPTAGLVQGLDGNLYGTTTYGGTGAGTVFRMSTAGELTTIYSFCERSKCPDGEGPNSNLLLATDGNFYGVTQGGGAYNAGTVFRITSAGVLTTLHSFDTTDGIGPLGGLVEGLDGNLYGTTYQGGANGLGTVFKITPAGALTTLHSFAGTDGTEPVGTLVQGLDGEFYGVTYSGGTYLYGTIFKITSTGTLTTLHNFADDTDGYYPDAGLALGNDGNFYGTTLVPGAGAAPTSGPNAAYGTVFKITPGGSLTTLHSFDFSDGANPSAALIQATDGHFYGTTALGGTTDNGTLFRMTTGGSLTVLESFYPKDGTIPSASLVQATNGAFYGTAYQGGADHTCNTSDGGCGTVFTLSVGLGAFVETLPTSGKIGLPVKILGTDLTGTTSVTFNGVPATFTVLSATEITTAVPSGATTGPVQVTTASGTLSSNVRFRVIP